MSRRENSEWPLPFAKPEEVGLSSERLARIRPALQEFIDQKKVPNLITLVARHGKVVHFDAQGYMDFDSKKSASKDTIFRLYSNSKPITGVATMILYEEGLLNLDDPVSKYIPAFKNQRVHVSETTEGAVVNPLLMIATVPARRGITIRDCLRNTTGLATPQRAPMSFMRPFKDVMIELGWYPDSLPSKASFRERVEALAKLPLNFQPGTEFEYHVGYPVMGVIIETIVGKTLEEYYQERIFRPLGMKDTSFYLSKRKLNCFPPLYQPKLENGEWKLAIVERPETSEKVKGPKIYFGAGGDMGGILSTVADYTRFAQMLLNGGELDGVRILSRKTVELMTSSHTGNIFIPMLGHGFGFGMGVGVHIGGRWAPRIRSVGAYGWGGAAGTNYFADPKEGLLAVCFTQVLGQLTMLDYQEEFERLVYQALL
jgi:CubicO group peptidase (beta-lactamase class C family)